MKTKVLLLFAFLLIVGQQLIAQDNDSDVEIVNDPATRETFIRFHQKQWDEFLKMKENQGTIAATQELVRNESQEIARIQGEFYNSLSQVNNILCDIRSVIVIAQDTRDIFQYLYECDTITMSNPELLLIAMNTKLAIVERIEHLGTYLALALTGGELNLMNNKDRLVFISKVSTETKILKGYANYLRFELQLALKNGFWQSLFPGLFQWESRLEYNTRTCESIIQSFHLE